MSITSFPGYMNRKSLWGMDSLESVERYRTRKAVAKAAMTAGSIASTGAQLGTHVSVIALATGAAAVSASGIGLVIVGGALTAGSSIFSARSAYKTYQHRNVLSNLQSRATAMPCEKIPDHGKAMPGVHSLHPRNYREHNVVGNEVLPYVIEQKSSKLHRKVVSSVPGLGIVEGVRAAGNKAVKLVRGTQGVERLNAARWLAVHLITHNCALAQAMVSELYSFDELLILQTFDSDKLAPLLADKMKST
jgi:hypothetical protein